MTSTFPVYKGFPLIVVAGDLLAIATKTDQISPKCCYSLA